MNKEFNYCIGHYWHGKSGEIGTYTYFGEVRYGTLTEAKEMLDYVKEQDPKNAKKYKIFKVVEMKDQE